MRRKATQNPNVLTSKLGRRMVAGGEHRGVVKPWPAGPSLPFRQHHHHLHILSLSLSSMTSSSASSRKILSKIACNRLQKELLEWQVNPPAGFKHKVTDNLQRWVIEVNGAPGTLYSNETYQLQVDFPEHYPMEAPQVSAKHRLKRRGRASFEIDFEGMAGNWGWGKVGALDVKIWALEVEEERAKIVEFWI